MYGIDRKGNNQGLIKQLCCESHIMGQYILSTGMALTSIKICSEAGESYSVQIFWWVGKGRREIPITCVWTIALPMKLLNLVKCFCPGQHSLWCQVNWTQRNRCHFTGLFRIHTVIITSREAGTFNKNNKKKIITWMPVSVTSQRKARQHPCKSRADSFTEI